MRHAIALKHLYLAEVQLKEWKVLAKGINCPKFQHIRRIFLQSNDFKEILHNYVFGLASLVG